MRLQVELKKVGISFGISLAILLVSTLLFSTLYYFNIMSTNVFTIFQMIIPLISVLTGGIIIGRHSKEKGWLEGLKLGLVVSVLFCLLSFLGFDNNISLPSMIYYLILIAVTIFGSMIGINHQKKD